MPYTPHKPQPPETPEQLRARIPGWGVDLDPKDRPSVPRERFDPDATGAHWEFPNDSPRPFRVNARLNTNSSPRSLAPQRH